jgi:hypothetical protein
MSLKGGYLAAVVVAAAVLVAPSAGADPVVGGGSADATINELREQGYDVAVNWVSGDSNAPLGTCHVAGIHNPDQSSDRDPATFTTVYVDVACPDHQAPVGIGFGIGF